MRNTLSNFDDPALLARRDPLARLVEHAATNLDKPPRYHATNNVQCRSGKLSRVLWQGSQWAVTVYGIEASALGK